MPANPILIAACGNALAGDDAFGPAVASELSRMNVPGVDTVDLGNRPAALLDELEGRQAVCVVDAAMSEVMPPGELLEMDFFCRHGIRLAVDEVVSTHGLSIASQLSLARKLGQLPHEVHLVAAVLDDVKFGTPMSYRIAEQVIPACELIKRWVARQQARLAPE